jgi:hypothetical protein
MALRVQEQRVDPRSSSFLRETREILGEESRREHVLFARLVNALPPHLLWILSPTFLGAHSRYGMGKTTSPARRRSIAVLNTNSPARRKRRASSFGISDKHRLLVRPPLLPRRNLS